MRHKLSLYGYTNFKKVHNFGAPVPNLTQQITCTFTLHKYHVYKLSCRCLDNLGISMRLKTAMQGDLSPVFAMSPSYLNRVKTFKTLHNRTHNALSDDHYIYYA